MTTLRHRSVSGELAANCWEYDAARRVLDCVVDGFGLVIPVCCYAMRRAGAFPIRRISFGANPTRDRWRVAPVRFEAPTHHGDELVSIACAYPLAEDALGRVDPETLALILDLTDAPVAIDRALEAL